MIDTKMMAEIGVSLLFVGLALFKVKDRTFYAVAWIVSIIGIVLMFLSFFMEKNWK